VKPSSYGGLPERFFARLNPTPVASPRLIKFNAGLAGELGLGVDADSNVLAQRFSGNRVPAGLSPIAAVYAGHQFGQFVPQLGDGRAILLGESSGSDGSGRDIQLKGSGRTPYSRGGDGRAAVGPVLREYLVSEAMHALGIPTTRALAAVSTGEWVERDRRLPGAVLTRVAASHVRVGTFEYFAARGDIEGTRLLADYVIQRHYPQAAGRENPYLSLLEQVTARQASLIAAWMQVGFIHGVMNTDNMAVSGETLDFGPCAFMDAFDPGAVFSSIDRQGRYAYGNQPHAAAWNLSRFAETLLPLIEPKERAVDLAQQVIAGFSSRFQNWWLEGLRRKLGLETRQPADATLGTDLLETMHRNQADFTLTFRGLCDAAGDTGADAVVRSLFADPHDYDAWAVRWRQRLAQEGPQPTRVQAMQRVNPVYIPRNHQIEKVIAAAEAGDFAPFEALSAALSHPYRGGAADESYASAPRAEERVLQTFCGT
jgi:uncharacterized protein YdiU (UPF0061 family)